MAKVSVVVTVFNEEKTIKQLIDSLESQTKKPDEIIIVDGASTDKTVEIAKKYVKVFVQPGNRSVGRNFGIAKSKSEIIAITDAGCIPHKNWLEELVKPFSDKKTKVVSGYYEGLAENVFQKCLIPYVLVMPDKITGEFWPSTRSMAIRRDVGQFDERLSHNEDYAFANALKIQGVDFAFAPRAIVAWMPRKNLIEAAWMFMRFAIGDAQAGILRSKVKLMALRYYLFFFLFFVNSWFGLLIIPYIIWAIFKNYKYVQDVRAIYWLPVLQITSDIMVLFGTVVGLLSRIK